ncbi:Putative uncharacterized hydrolase C7D4.05-like protein [Cladobotryum mycophilum]|uniref:Uncharacterized hydrolase C7D4.05-like protein n=1 Tax=Cladobotryum mycophilum TaxID=491253 RepID=A0ABR0SSF2_9HYPO
MARPRPNLLLCLDAFGTLFRPKRTVAQQYGEVARRCGLVGFSDEELEISLRAAMKDEAKRNPNYGKATGLGATRWWANAAGAILFPRGVRRRAQPRIHPGGLRHQNTPQRRFERVVVGVVTNSDDRVPSILSSLGIKVSPSRYGTAEAEPGAIAERQEDYDIDFHCMSYDVGAEKPDVRIFQAAELMLARLIAVRDGKRPAEAAAESTSWQKVYVGDEYAKDVVGAVNASWNPVLLDAEDRSDGVPRLEHYPTRALDELFQEHAVVRVRSIQNLVSWLMGEGRSEP